MKKILSLLVCVCVLLSAMVFTASADSVTYTKIDTIENLEAGDYIMAAYLTKDSSNADLSATPYQCFTGSVGSGKLYTSKYSFTDGVLTTSESYKMVEVTLAAIEGKANTYTLHVANKGYIYSTSSTDNHKLAIAENNAMEWTASNHSGGGIIFTASNGTVLGTASATSQFIRGYKAGSTTPTGMYFFEETTTTGGNEPACTHTATSTEANGNETHKVVCDDCGETVTASVDCTDADVNGKCDVCGGDVAAPFDPTDKTAAEIVDAAYELTGSETIENVTLKGKIVKVDYAYNAERGDITVTIAVEGADATKTIQCYKMTGENIADLTYDDVITVTGTIKNYNGTIEFDKPVCTAVEKAVVENNDPAADSVLTIKEALELGASKKHNVYTENKYYITGEIKSFSGDRGKEFGNIVIADAEGNEILVYGTWDETGEIRYDALENPPVEGDTVTVYGVIGQYNGTAQMKNGWFKAAPVVDDDDDTTGDGKDDTAGDTTGGSTTTTPEVKPNTDTSTTSPATGDNMGAIAMMAIAAAAVILYTNKKR